MKNSVFFAYAIHVLSLGCGSSDSGAGSLDSADRPRDLGPVGEGAGVRVYSGSATALIDGNPCTSEEGAAGERWCGFEAVSSDQVHSLYVVNVSRLMKGTAIDCAMPDQDCLLLSEQVGGSGANFHPTFFSGDTLVYYDQWLVPHAWRPGMERGRVLAERPDSLDLIFCEGAARGSGVACLGLHREQPDPAVVVADLYAGAADGTTEPLLSPTASVIWASLADGNGVSRFRYDFPDSSALAWSSRESSEGPEVLKIERVQDPMSEVAVASDVHAWKVSPDGARWFWLSGADASGTGLLQTAPFPDGLKPREVLAEVADYGQDGAGTLIALTRDREIWSMADPIETPADRQLVDQDVEAFVELSEHGYISYAKHFDGPKIIDLFTSRLDGSQRCTLDTSVSVPLNSFHFSPRAQGAIWAVATSQGYDAYYTRLDDCSTQTLATDIIMLNWLGRSAVFLDGFDPVSGTGSVRFRDLSMDGTLDTAPPTLISENVGTYARSDATLVYTVNTGGDADGVYIRAFAP